MTTPNKEIQVTDFQRFKTDLEIIKKEFEKIIQSPATAKQMRSLTKFSIYIKQIHYDSKRLALHPKIRRKAKAIERFLETPLAPPFTMKMSLAEAAITFSEQHPHESDLSEILKEISQQQGPPEFLKLFSSAKDPVSKS